MASQDPKSTELLEAGREYAAVLAAYETGMKAFGIEQDTYGLNAYPPELAPLSELQAAFLAAQRRLLYAAKDMQPD